MADGNVNWDNFLESNSARKEPNVCSCPLAQQFNFEESFLRNWESSSFPLELCLLYVLCFNTISRVDGVTETSKSA